MGTGFAFQWEVDLMIRLQSVMDSGLITAAKCFTEIGGEVVVILFMLLLYLCVNKEWGVTLGVNVLTGLSISTQLKNIVLRRRPYFDHPEILCLAPVEKGDVYSVLIQGYSFPSMHSVNATVLFGSIAAEIRKKWVTLLSILLIFAIGSSRVLLGNHYPTDVLSGWLIGSIVLFGLGMIRRRVQEKWKVFLVLILISLPGMFFAATNDYFTIFGAMLGFFGGVLFEERVVRFQNTRKILHIILRLVLGGVIYFGLNTLLKMPFSDAFLESGSAMAFAVRALRYAVILFVESGVYPILFNKWKILS